VTEEVDPELYGRDLFGDVIKPKATGPVAERFTFPPFTVLDGRSGEWLERKRAWVATGLKSELGRVENLTYTATAAFFDFYRVVEGTRETTQMQGTSIFCPVLCELNYRWFCPPGGTVVDPFAGGSVRGIVAGEMGLHYWGCDLSAAQVAANRQQAIGINPAVAPEWACGDALEQLAYAPDADFIFSCPPYGDLERYSDDPRDLSTMEYNGFLSAYGLIIHRAVARLKPDTFASFVVGDFRDAQGFYRGFVGHTVQAFERAGARFYNEAVLLNPVGTGSLRVTRQFAGGRKLIKLHQNLLVFCKGNWKAASAKCLREGERGEEKEDLDGLGIYGEEEL